MNKCNRCMRMLNQNMLIKSEKCSDHSYCYKCRSILKSKKEIIPGCKYCNGHYSKKYKSVFKSCLICDSKSKIYVHFCHKHLICGSCLYQIFPEESANPDIKCKYCMLIITKFCRNCFIYLEDNEKFFKRPCDIHFFCQGCVGNYEIENNCKLCQASDAMKKNNLVLISESEHECNMIKATQSINFQNIGTKNQDLNQIDSKSLDYRANLLSLQAKPNLNKCEGCSSEAPVLLECNHKYCFNCILIRFRQDFNLFMQLISENRFDDIENQEFCIRCPCSYADCFLKFIYPFNKHFVANEILSCGGKVEQFIDCFGSFFDGNKMKFMICASCKNIVGVSGQSGLCLYCNSILHA